MTPLLAKNVFRILLRLFFLPILVLKRFGNREDALLQTVSQIFSLLPGYVGACIRREAISLFLTRIGKNVIINFGTIFSRTECALHDNTYIGTFCCIGNVCVEKDTMIGDHVCILSGKHQHLFADIQKPARSQPGEYEKICVGEDCWIGSHSVIMANVGMKCIVGAGSVVLHDVDDYLIVAGNPAKAIRKRIS